MKNPKTLNPKHLEHKTSSGGVRVARAYTLSPKTLKPLNPEPSATLNPKPKKTLKPYNPRTLNPKTLKPQTQGALVLPVGARKNGRRRECTELSYGSLPSGLDALGF